MIVKGPHPKALQDVFLLLHDQLDDTNGVSAEHLYHMILASHGLACAGTVRPWMMRLLESLSDEPHPTSRRLSHLLLAAQQLGALGLRDKIYWLCAQHLPCNFRDWDSLQDPTLGTLRGESC